MAGKNAHETRKARAAEKSLPHPSPSRPWDSIFWYNVKYGRGNSDETFSCLGCRQLSVHRQKPILSERATIGRRWPALLVVALSLLAPAAARAGFTSIYTLGSGDAGRELANNTVYKVESDLTLTNTGTGPGLSVASGATVVLYIKKGATLTVNGGNSSGRSAGDAGLRVLSGRTLVVTGGGKLVATGGNAGNGVNGGDAGSCSLNMSGDSHGGQGGAGGNGGAGASAGIGGYGGYGGYGGSRPSDESWVETNDTDDYDPGVIVPEAAAPSPTPRRTRGRRKADDDYGRVVVPTGAESPSDTTETATDEMPNMNDEATAESDTGEAVRNLAAILSMMTNNKAVRELAKGFGILAALTIIWQTGLLIPFALLGGIAAGVVK